MLDSTPIPAPADARRERRRDQPAAPARQPGPAAILALQRSAGNRAVAAMLARQAPAATPAATAVPEGGTGAGAVPDGGLIATAESLWQEDPGTAIRLGCELLRPFPLVGMIPALTSDIIGAGQDLATVPTGDLVLAGLADGTIVVRSLVNLVNDGIGQVLAVTQPTQVFLEATDLALLASEFGIPLEVITVPLTALVTTINEGLDGSQMGLSILTGVLDTIVMLEAAAGLALGPVADRAGWDKLLAGYIANIFGDALGFGNEALGAALDNHWPSGTVGQLGKAALALGRIVVEGLMLGKNWALGFWNVLGSDFVRDIQIPDLRHVLGDDPGLEPTGPGTPDPPFGQFSAGSPSPEWFGARLQEIDALRGCSAHGDAVLAAAGEQFPQIMQSATAMAEQAGPGRAAVAELRAATAALAGDVEPRIAAVGDVGTQAAAARAMLAGPADTAAATIAFLEGLQMPELPLPQGTPGIAEIAAALESAKNATLEPLRELQARLASLGELVDAVAEAAQMLTARLTELLRHLSAGLEQTDALDHAITELLDGCAQITAAAGEATSIPELHAAWAQLGPVLEDAARACQSPVP